jgi:hypothetical protein
VEKCVKRVGEGGGGYKLFFSFPLTTKIRAIKGLGTSLLSRIHILLCENPQQAYYLEDKLGITVEECEKTQNKWTFSKCGCISKQVSKKGGYTLDKYI